MISQMIKENKTQKQVITKRLIDAIDNRSYTTEPYIYVSDGDTESEDESFYHTMLEVTLCSMKQKIYTAMICVIDEMKILLEPLKIKENKCKKQDYNKAYRLKKKEEQYLGYSV